MSRRLFPSRALWIGLPLALTALVLAASVQLARSPNHGLPYHDSFAAGKAEEWKAFGGTWEIQQGAMRNNSDERGAKLLTGSGRWKNYSIEADVMLLGAGGDAGLIARSSDEEEGVDSYTGYYAGLRNLDNTLVLGRAGHGWSDVLTPFTPNRHTVLADRWYHLKLLAYDCQLVVAAGLAGENSPMTLAVKDADCVRSGRAGLRSYASGGVWRNVVVKPATEQDLATMLASVRHEEDRDLPQQASADTNLNALEVPQTYYRTQTLASNPNAQTISSLKLFPIASQDKVTVRGIVILTSPALFVQDSTGGMLIKQSTHEPMRVGDEVEATGVARPGDFSACLEDATVRVLWGGTPMPALSVTASQAATGAFDATFIEVEGRLRNKQYGPDETLLFDFDAGPQSFRAMIKRGRGDDQYNKLQLGSLLRVRGVSVVDPAYTQDITPFTLLVRSTDDITELAGPPWWSTGNLVAIAIAFLLLALLANFIYHRVESWRLRAIVQEREHLAFEMHDTLAQGFAGIGFQLEAIRTRVPEEQTRMHEQINLASDLVRHSHAEARRTVDMLRPRQLESEGLLSALTLCGRRLVAAGSVVVASTSVGEVRAVPLRISDNLYRIGQEALANAVRHAHPTTLDIVLEYTRDSVQLLIRDDGVGFIQRDDLGGFGVLGMRKRASSISAKLEITTVVGSGTQVSVTAPLPPRITFISWPGLMSRFLREHLHHATTAEPPNPHPYRR